MRERLGVRVVRPNDQISPSKWLLQALKWQNLQDVQSKQRDGPEVQPTIHVLPAPEAPTDYGIPLAYDGFVIECYKALSLRRVWSSIVLVPLFPWCYCARSHQSFRHRIEYLVINLRTSTGRRQEVQVLGRCRQVSVGYRVRTACDLSLVSSQWKTRVTRSHELGDPSTSLYLSLQQPLSHDEPGGMCGL